MAKATPKQKPSAGNPPSTPTPRTGDGETSTPPANTPVEGTHNPPLTLELPTETIEQAAQAVAADAPDPNPDLQNPPAPVAPLNKGGRPKGYSPKAKQEQERVILATTARRNGEGTADLFLLCAQSIGGREWAPDDDQERQALRQGFADTYEHYGWGQTPGWLPLASVVLAYGGKRLNRPQTSSWFHEKRAKLVGYLVSKGLMRKPSGAQTITPTKPPSNPQGSPGGGLTADQIHPGS